jgi:hypothetical protein
MNFSGFKFIDSYIFGLLMFHTLISAMYSDGEIFVCAKYNKSKISLWFNGEFTYD